MTTMARAVVLSESGIARRCGPRSLRGGAVLRIADELTGQPKGREKWGRSEERHNVGSHVMALDGELVGSQVLVIGRSHAVTEPRPPRSPRRVMA